MKVSRSPGCGSPESRAPASPAGERPFPTRRRHERRPRGARRTTDAVDRRAHRHPRAPHRRDRRDAPRRSRSTAAARRDQERRPHARPTIDLLVVATATPEQPIPHTGAFVGDGLGLRCGSFDLGAACAGFVVRARRRRVDAATPATRARARSSAPRRCRASSTPTTAARASSSATARPPPCSRRRPTTARASSRGTSVATARPPGLLEIPAGGSRLPATAETVAARRALPQDAGPGGVPPRGARASSSRRASTLERAGRRPPTTSTGSSRTRPTSASSKPRRTGSAFRRERTIVNIERYGNTSSASIPLALFEAVDDGRVQRRRPRAHVGLRRRHDVGERAPAMGPAMTRRCGSAFVDGGVARASAARLAVALAPAGHPVGVLLRQRRRRRRRDACRGRAGRRAARRSRCAPTSPTPTRSTPLRRGRDARSGRSTCS